MDDYRGERRGRSALAWVALAAAAISALGIAILLFGIVFDIEGAEENEEGPFIFDLAWGSYFLGAIAALIAGAAAYVLGGRRGDRDTRRAGVIALGWFVVALIIFIIAAATT